MGTEKAIITLDSIVVRNNDVMSSEIDGEVVMMTPDMKEYLGMNENGSHIWSLLEEKIMIIEIIDSMIIEFEVDFDTCKNDVLEFLNDLLKYKIIKLDKVI
jgi:hypothetical protein